MRIEFEESCVPPKTGHHHKRIVRIAGFARMADKPELVAAKNFWDTLFLAHRPQKPLEGPLRASIVITWPWNASDPKRLKARGFVVHDKKPDLSNFWKTAEDSMARCGLFTNDSQIADLHIVKRRGDRPGIRVTIEEMEGER